MFDVITGIALLVLACLAICNWIRVGAVADSLGLLANDSHTDTTLRILKKQSALEIRLLKNKIENLEKSRLSTQVMQESRPAEIQPS